MKPVYQLKVWQEDDWWLARVVDASDGADRTPLNALTQARSLARIEPMGRDLIATILDADEDGFEVEVDYVLPEDAGQLVREARAARDWLEAAQDVWQERSATAARALTGRGYSLRETATLLGLSHQRVDQLLGGDARNRQPWNVWTWQYQYDPDAGRWDRHAGPGRVGINGLFVLVAPEVQEPSSHGADAFELLTVKFGALLSEAAAHLAGGSGSGETAGMHAD